MKTRMNQLKMNFLALALCAGAIAFSGCAKDRKIVLNEERTLAFDYFHAGQALETQGQFTQALEQYTKAYESSPRPAFAYKLGEINHRIGDQKVAIEYYDKAITGAGDYEIAQARKAQAELELSEGRETDLKAFESRNNSSFKTMTKPQPEKPVVTRTVAGNSEFETRNEAEIVDALFPELDPERKGSSTTLREKANSAIGQQRWGDAVSPLQQLYREDPSVENSIDFSRALYYSGQKNRAFEEFEAANKRFPDDADISVQWGRLLAMDGKWEEADQVFEKGLNAHPDSLRLKINRASLRIDQGRYTDAVSLLEPVVAANPNNFAASYNLSLALLGEGNDLNRARDISLQLADNFPSRRSQVNDLLQKLGVDY